MNTQDIVNQIAPQFEGEITKKALGEVISAVVSAIVAGAKAGESVHVSNFGRFVGNHRPARAGRNPKTGETVQIEARTSLKFKPTVALKTL